MHCLSINATEKRGAALMRKARPPPPPTTLYRRLRKWGFSATNHASGPVAPCSSPLSGGALVGRFGCGMPLNMAVPCPENRHGSPTTSPPGLQSLLTLASTWGEFPLAMNHALTGLVWPMRRTLTSSLGGSSIGPNGNRSPHRWERLICGWTSRLAGMAWQRRTAQSSKTAC